MTILVTAKMINAAIRAREQKRGTRYGDKVKSRVSVEIRRDLEAALAHVEQMQAGEQWRAVVLLVEAVADLNNAVLESPRIAEQLLEVITKLAAAAPEREES